MKFFIFHGTYGNPEENWIPWLKKELAEYGDVIVPKFPTPEGQSLASWMEVLSEYDFMFDENTIFIGHSLGVVLALRKLEFLHKKIKACFLVAGFLGTLNNEEFDKLNESFFANDFNWDAIHTHCTDFKVYNSDNDPYVDIEKGHQIADFLKTDLIKVEGAGHFNTDAGFDEFPQLFEDIKKSL
jgi:predicted alpha/beta hydrolase family esterase